MTKAVFDYVIQSSNKITEKNQRMIAQVVIDSIPMFQKIPSHQRKAIVAAMNHVHYQPNQYLFRQFSTGETFYIVVEGTCKTTQSYVEGGAEREMDKFVAGDYIDEMALLDHAHVRSFNAISVDDLYCFVLSRNNFDLLMKSYNGGTMNKSIFEGLHHKESKQNGPNAYLRAKYRRVSAFDIENRKSSERSRRYLKTMCTFMAESLWISMYWRMFRSLSINTSLQIKYGSQATEVMRQNYDKNLAVKSIALLAKHILLRKPSERSNSDLQFIAGLLQQKNEFVKRYCENWTQHQFLLLARKLRLHSVGAMTRIFEKGSVANSAFLILKGSVRLFCQTHNETTNSRNLEYENDLISGDIIGEAALGGITERLQVALTIAPCEMIVIKTVDYKSVDELRRRPSFSINEMYHFLKKVPIFHHYEDFSVYRVACAMEPRTISKDQVVCKRGGAAETISFIYNGIVDILSDLDDTSPLAKLQQYDYFGESSVLRDIYLAGGHHNKKHKNKQDHSKKGNNEDGGEVKPTFHFRECFDCKASSSLDVLSLPKESFFLLDEVALQQLRTGYIGRMKWRASRADMIKVDKDNHSKDVALFRTQGNAETKVENNFVFDSVRPLDLKQYGVSQHIQSKRDISDIPDVNQKLNPLTLMATSSNAIVLRNNKNMLDRMLLVRNRRRPQTTNSLGFTTLFGRPTPTLHAEIAMNPMKVCAIREKVESKDKRQKNNSPIDSRIRSQSFTSPNQQYKPQDRIPSVQYERRPFTATAADDRVNGSQKIPPRASVCEMNRILGTDDNSWRISSMVGGTRGMTR